MSTGYFNTTHLRGDDLASAHRACSRQDASVLDVFRQHARPLTPSDVWRLTSDAGHSWPLTSVRRAITNLTDDGKLVKLARQRTGIYGRLEGCWALPGHQLELLAA
jgi:Fe2+ or Zn2+ uptake regulation protein